MRLLILGGTGEGAALAAACAARPELDVISSLAGRTLRPEPLPGQVRHGGFGGIAGLIAYLEAERIERVLDATHPFATRIGAHAAAACTALGLPRLRLLRPPWRPVAGDVWHEVAAAAAAVGLLPTLGRVALLTIGQRDLAPFAAMRACRFVVRTIEPGPPGLLPDAIWLQARGPFALEDELALCRAEGIEVLVTKASGGDATYPKLAAARALGLPVVMLQRPPPPPGPVVSSVVEALAWLEVSDA
jgi:precorrin-6A/cobalt-precorrin-6A reductase